MLSTGLTVYLKMTPEQLARRLLESSGERPLIKNVPDEHLETFIEKMLTNEKNGMEGQVLLLMECLLILLC